MSKYGTDILTPLTFLAPFYFVLSFLQKSVISPFHLHIHWFFILYTISISRGIFSSMNSENTPHSSPLKPRYWVPYVISWFGFCHNHLVLNIVLYMAAIYRVYGALSAHYLIEWFYDWNLCFWLWFMSLFLPLYWCLFILILYWNMMFYKCICFVVTFFTLLCQKVA